MKACLMHADQDFDLARELPPQAEDLQQDLELDTLFRAMAEGDKFLLEVARAAVLASMSDNTAIIYRQDILRDCLDHPAVVRELYGLAIAGIEAAKIPWRFSFSRNPGSVLSGAISVLELFLEVLKRMRQLADDHATKFRSAGFTAFFAMITENLDADYFALIEQHLRELRFRGGVMLSARLGQENKGTDYVLRRPHTTRGPWFKRLSLRNRSAYVFQIADRDEAGARAISELRDYGIDLVAHALSQSTDHILDFFTTLRCEVGFYVGCLNLHDRLEQKSEPTCFPLVAPSGRPALSSHDLRDVCLTLTQEGAVVGNDLDADGKTLLMITGANQGGKSTFLRGLGVAQLMMQAGMYVTAQSYRADIRTGVFTHFKREEDRSLRSGKLDEELSRMSGIADVIDQNCMVLFNESFAATNEREGSEVARQIIRALLEAGIKVAFVTHLFDLAHGLYVDQSDTSLSLRAERLPDGSRSFKVIEGEPLQTSYGQDLYDRIFATETDAASGRGEIAR
jgi:hypothetical protein